MYTFQHSLNIVFVCVCVCARADKEALSAMAALLWSNISAVLPPDEASFPLQFSDNVDPAMADLLLRCRRRLYARGSRHNVRLADAQIVADIAWEKLNTGTWRDVDKEWRRVYAYGCLFKALAQLCGDGGRGEGEEPGAESVRQAVRTCDLGLLMGASVLDGILQRLVRVLQTDVRRRARPEEEAQTKSPEAEVQAKVPLSFIHLLTL